MVEATKKQLRREMRCRRRALSSDQQQTAGDALSAHLLRLPGLAGGRRFAGYLANDGEIDPMPALVKLIGRGRQCFLPIIVPGRRPKLLFGPFDSSSLFAANHYGIPEPQVGPNEKLKAGELDWLFLPLVAFDRSGNRLGMGGGFYDATLEALRHRCHWMRPRLVGLAHEFQCVDRLDIDNWDVPLHGIVTESGYHSYRE